MPKKNRKPELMSPAGHWPQLQTAIEAGADAVYFGLNHFSARAKVGFELGELPEVMQTLHARGVKGFVTFNTLVFDHELELAESAIREIAAAGADAVIVQDIGMARLIGQIAPGLTIHGSTQMSVTSAEGAELAKRFGCQRIVLGRELSLSDIRRIAAATDVELEVFVHGALCVSYSGQCFSSEAWGGRSANRGKCAQACRLSYDLIVDDRVRQLGEFRYLLSPGDLYALEQVPQLMEIGVACLKIEGRYKGADYVAATTRAYRQAIDSVWQGQILINQDETKRELEQIYSRGLGPHFISGVNHQTVVIGRAPRHRGQKVGEVVFVGRHCVDVEADQPIKPGDGLVFDAAQWRSPDEPEEGGHVYEVTERKTGRVELKFGKGEVDFGRIRVGDWVWRSHDPQIARRLKLITTTEVPLTTRPIVFEVTAKVDQGLLIDAYIVDETAAPISPMARYQGTEPLRQADKRPLDQVTLHDKLGRLGGTPYHLSEIRWLSSDTVFVRSSELNEARRILVGQLFEVTGQLRPIPSKAVVKQTLTRLAAAIDDRPPAHSSRQVAPFVPSSISAAAQWHVLVRTPEQLTGVLQAAEISGLGLGSITLDYLELYGLSTSVQRIRAAGIRPRVASPRILKPSEQNIVHFLVSLEADVLVRSGGLLQPLQTLGRKSEPFAGSVESNPGGKRESVELFGDFSLNAANAVSCQTYLELGIKRITPTYDLNAQQITELTRYVPAQSLEVIAYSHLPVFHTEHCVFCRFLSQGTDSSNCGHPCEKHRVAVRDQSGRAHPVLADVGCRNTVFGSEAQFIPSAITDWLAAGIEHFRIEFVHQSSQQVQAISEAFAGFLARQIRQSEFESIVAANSPQQTTEGSLFVPRDFKQLVQLG
jgi:putative protease